MVKRLYLQGLFLIFTFLGYTQTYVFKGELKNEMGEPIIGAQFIKPSSLKIIALSNDLGFFEFISDTNVLLVQQIGYSSKRITFNDQFITLKEASKLLNAVVVSENKRATLLKEATISMAIIQPNLIENTSPTNAIETIERINAVQIVDNQPIIRGGSGWSYGAGSRVGVLVDGVPMLSGDAGQPLWNFIPTEGISGVEIIKGASSVIYGSSALNGIIHLKTRKPTVTPYTRVSLSSGFYSLPKRQSLHYQGNKRNTLSNMTAFHSGIYTGIGVSVGLNLLDDQSYKMSDYDKRGRVHLGLRKTAAKHHLIYGLNAAYQEGKSGSFLLWESLALGYTIADSVPNQNLSQRLSIDPYIKWQKGNFSYTLNTRFLTINNDVENGDIATDQSNASNLWYAEFQSNYSPKNSYLNVTGGIVVMSSYSKSPLFEGDHYSKNYASYIQLDYPWKKLRLSGGGRYEHFVMDNRSEGKPVFRAGLNYSLAKYTFLRSSFGQGYRFPSIAESFIKTSVGPVSVYPSNQLVSESGTNLEIAIQQGFSINQIQLMLDVAFFQTRYHNMMEFTFGQWGLIEPPTYGAGFKTLNTGETSVKGIESNLLFEGSFNSFSVQGFFGYTYTASRALEPTRMIAPNISYRNSSSDTTQDVLKYRPRHLAKADIMVRYKKWHIGTGVTYQSVVQNIDGAFTLLIQGVQESVDQELSEHLVFNTRVGYEINSRWDSNLIFSNITNKEYTIRPADIASPRSIRFQIAYTLDKSK